MVSPGISSVCDTFCCFCLSGNKGWDGLNVEAPFPLNKNNSEKNNEFNKLQVQKQRQRIVRRLSREEHWLPNLTAQVPRGRRRELIPESCLLTSTQALWYSNHKYTHTHTHTNSAGYVYVFAHTYVHVFAHVHICIYISEKEAISLRVGR